MINGVTQLLMMKADVLSVFRTIKVCTQYKLKNGRITDELPYELVNESLSPVYEDMRGWNTALKGMTEKTIPVELQEYIGFVEHLLGVPITLISTGPDRTQTIHRQAAMV
jgi:adenylosuccinate synthase